MGFARAGQIPYHEVEDRALAHHIGLRRARLTVRGTQLTRIAVYWGGLGFGFHYFKDQN